MKNIDIKKIVENTPHMTLTQAERLTNLMQSYNVSNVLELGFAHGVSSCYIAAALKRMGNGHLTTIDLQHSRERNPNISELLTKTGLTEYVTYYFEETSYNWRLMKFLDQKPQPEFDFCYLDGAHNWFVDGLAFYLVNQMLKPSGWIVFDDLNWTYAKSPSYTKTGLISTIPEEQRDVPQVKKIFELLVMTHPEFHNFHTEHGWAYAQKKG